MTTETISAFATNFSDNFHKLAQERTFRFEGTCSVEIFKGQDKIIERSKGRDMKTRTGQLKRKEYRHQEYSRRRLILSTADWDDCVQEEVLEETLTNPKSDMLEQAVAAVARKKNQIFIDNALGSVLAVDETGANSNVTFATDVTGSVAHGGTLVTKAKLDAIHQWYNGLDIDENDTRYLVLSAIGIQSMTDIDQLTNSDYQTISNLNGGAVAGQVYGFTVIRSNQLPLASGVRTCFSYTRSGMCYGMNTDQVRIEVKQDTTLEGNPWAVMAVLKFGALRKDGQRVFKLSIKES